METNELRRWIADLKGNIDTAGDLIAAEMKRPRPNRINIVSLAASIVEYDHELTEAVVKLQRIEAGEL